MKLVEVKGIPLICFSSREFKPFLRKRALKEGNVQLIDQWRGLYDREIMERVQKYKVQAIFLAGYMLILGRELCGTFPILNLHPALPGGPKGTWQQIIWHLIKEGAQQTGIMIHRATPELDAGPALTYCTFPLTGQLFDPLWKRMQEKLQQKTLSDIQKEEGEKEPLFSAIREQQIQRELPLVLTTLHLLSQGTIDLHNLEKPILMNL